MIVSQPQERMVETMADAPTYDWGSVTGHAVELLKAPKIPDVPAEIVRQAQRSYDGVPLKKDGKEIRDEDGNVVVTHNLHHTFPSEEMAAAFAKHMKNAGLHTTPKASVTVVIDPLEKQDKKTVGWKAGKRRGRATV